MPLTSQHLQQIADYAVKKARSLIPLSTNVAWDKSKNCYVRINNMSATSDDLTELVKLITISFVRLSRSVVPELSGLIYHNRNRLFAKGKNLLEKKFYFKNTSSAYESFSVRELDHYLMNLFDKDPSRRAQHSRYAEIFGDNQPNDPKKAEDLWLGFLEELSSNAIKWGVGNCQELSYLTALILIASYPIQGGYDPTTQYHLPPLSSEHHDISVEILSIMDNGVNHALVILNRDISLAADDEKSWENAWILDPLFEIAFSFQAWRKGEVAALYEHKNAGEWDWDSIFQCVKKNYGDIAFRSSIGGAKHTPRWKKNSSVKWWKPASLWNFDWHDAKGKYIKQLPSDLQKPLYERNIIENEDFIFNEFKTYLIFSAFKQLDADIKNNFNWVDFDKCQALKKGVEESTNFVELAEVVKENCSLAPFLDIKNTFEIISKIIELTKHDEFIYASTNTSPKFF